MNRPGSFSISPRALADSGLSLQQLCQQAGVPVADAWGTDDFFRLWAAADALLGEPAAGLRFGSEGIARGHAVASVVGLHAANFRQAIDTLARYKRLTCPELVECDVAGSEATVRYRWLEATREVPRLLVDTTLASLQELARLGSGGQVAPIRVELARRVRDKALLQDHFGCPVVFGAEHDAMVFESAALDAPFVTADGHAFARLLSGLEARLLEGQGFHALVGQCRVAIARQLSEGCRVSVAAVARRLGTTGRTLQRHLGEHRTTFQEQLDGVRRTTATRLLAHTELDGVAIAMLLGFAEPNSFARAFRAWEQTTPARWREREAAASS